VIGDQSISNQPHWRGARLARWLQVGTRIFWQLEPTWLLLDEDVSWNKQSVKGLIGWFGADNRPKHYWCTSSNIGGTSLDPFWSTRNTGIQSIFSTLLSWWQQWLQPFAVSCKNWLIYLFYQTQNTHTQTTVSRPFVQDYQARPVPEETFTHSHPSWSSDILHQLPPATTIYSILLVQFTCLTVLFHKLFSGPL